MGGRGGNSGLKNNPYAAWSKDALERRMRQVDAEINSKRTMASLVGSSSSAVQRRAANAKRAIDKLNKEYALLEQALKRRKKSKEIIPF